MKKINLVIFTLLCLGMSISRAENPILCGMTWAGGSLNKGAIISFNPSTNVEDTVHSFGGGKDGQKPFGDLVLYTPCSLSVSASVIQNELCNGGAIGSVNATVAGGVPPFTYSWSGGGTNSSVSSLNAGTYTLTVQDNNGCTGSASAIITQPGAMVITSDSINDRGVGPCEGQASVMVSGGVSPYTYLWTPGNETNQSITSQCEGRYCCTVTDNNGCVDSACVTIVDITGINCINNTNQITVYPNPSTGQFAIQSSVVGEQSSVVVYNMLGEKIYSQFNIQRPTFNINLSSQPNGVYLYRVISETGNLLGEGKLIIQK